MDLYFKVYGPKNALLEFVDLNDTSLQVGGPLVHFTLFKILIFLNIKKEKKR